jgi:N-acetylmuramoyl-L-alanine amidase
MAKLIAIDPGHSEDTYENTGGKGVAPGGNIFEEHWFNAEVARKLKRLLDANGFRTFFTQTPGAHHDVGLTARTDEANAKGADLLVSIHANAGVKAANGACAFYWHTSEGGRKLAQLWADNARNLLAEVGLHGDGLHECVPGTWTNFHMVREAEMVAMLVEHGFMTNESDLSYLRTAAYREDCAEALARSIYAYFGVEYKANVKAAAKPKDTKKYRLVTGKWTIAAGIADAKKQLRDAGYGMLLYEIAEQGGNKSYQIVNPKYRLMTGTYVGKSVAEAKAKELQDKFGWKIYVVEA